MKHDISAILDATLILMEIEPRIVYEIIRKGEMDSWLKGASTGQEIEFMDRILNPCSRSDRGNKESYLSKCP